MCLDSQCRFECSADGDCAPGFSCTPVMVSISDAGMGGSCTQIAVVGMSCGVNSDCELGQICGVDGECHAGCYANRDCAVDQFCDLGSGSCVGRGYPEKQICWPDADRFWLGNTIENGLVLMTSPAALICTVPSSVCGPGSFPIPVGGFALTDGQVSFEAGLSLPPSSYIAFSLLPSAPDVPACVESRAALEIKVSNRGTATRIDTSHDGVILDQIEGPAVLHGGIQLRVASCGSTLFIRATTTTTDGTLQVIVDHEIDAVDLGLPETLMVGLRGEGVTAEENNFRLLNGCQP